MLLPSLTITLVKTHTCASQGLEVKIQRNCAMMASMQKGDLTGSLEQLSGGQRTLVSLALLLSAAQVGSGMGRDRIVKPCYIIGGPRYAVYKICLESF